MEKSCRKCAPKASPRSLFNVGYNPNQPLHTINSFKNKILKEDYHQTSKKLTLFFILNPVLYNGQSYQKQKGPGTSDQLVFRLRKKFRKISLLVKYCLNKFDDVI